MNDPYDQPGTPEAPQPPAQEGTQPPLPQSPPLTYPPLPEFLTPEAPKPRRSPLLGILLGILIVIAILAAVVFVDPFKWNVVGNIKVLLGLGGDPVVESMPANPALYLGVDLLNIQPEKLNRLYKPFAAVLDPGKSADANTGLTDLDKNLKDSIGITLTDDIIPWAGRSAGVAITDIKFNDYGSVSSATIIFSVQSRDNARADEFLAKLRNNLEAKNDYKFVQTAYSGIDIYAYLPSGDGFGNGLALARSGDVVLFSLSQAGIQAAIDAQKGGSLANDSGYQDMLKQLPGERFMTFYYDVQAYADLLNEMTAAYGTTLPQSNSQVNDQLKKIKGMLLSLSIVDAGLQMDTVVSYALDKMTAEEQKAILQFQGPVNTSKMLPADTLFFFGTNIANSAWLQMTDALASLQGASAEEFDQAMIELEKQIGMNPNTDLFPYLGGEFIVAGMPSMGGLLQQSSNLNLGAAALIETSDSGKMMDAVDKLSAAILPGGAESKKVGDLTYYAITDPSTDGEMLALGVGKQYLVLGTSGSLVEGLFSGKSSLASSASYQSAIATLPKGSIVSFYIDLKGLFANLRETMAGDAQKEFDQQVKFFEPIPAIVAGGSVVGQNMAKATFVILVTAAK